MVGLTGLLCAALELHRRTFAPGKPAIPPYRLVLVVKPAFSLVREPIILTIKKTAHKGRPFFNGRIDWTRTSDLFVPNEAFYQAELQSVNGIPF